MYEVVKRVKDTTIWRRVGASGQYIVHLDGTRFLTFRTVKEATKYIENNM